MSSIATFTQLDTIAAVRAVYHTLCKIDERLVEHGDRVAFIACELCDEGNLNMDIKTLFLISAFHDIGAYKTDEIDRMLEFETQSVWNHSVYGYLFLKYMTPLRDYADAVLYHHASWKEIQNRHIKCGDYAALIHLADRIDIVRPYGEDSPQLNSLLHNAEGLFNEEHVRIFRQCYKKRRLFERIEDNSFLHCNLDRCSGFITSASEAMEFLKMIVYTIDFRSEFTVTHTINTVSIALNIASHFGLDKSQQENIYLGALLHDVGKIAISEDILEYPGRLSDEQMAIMRTHVKETEDIIKGIVSDEICQIAIRHHEKLDGTGYPYGLHGEELTLPQRIVAVADIVSALCSRRSYKEPFPKERTLNILNQMSNTQLDKSVCQYIIDNFDRIILTTEEDRKNVIKMYRKIISEFHEMSATSNNDKDRGTY